MFNYLQYVQGNEKRIKKNCHVVAPTGEAIWSYTLHKSDLGATTTKIRLLFVSRHITPVAGCGFVSYT